MVQEHIQAWPEDRPKQLDCTLRLNVKEFSSKDDLIQNTVHENFIHGFKYLFKSEPLVFNGGHIVQDDISRSA